MKRGDRQRLLLLGSRPGAQLGLDVDLGVDYTLTRNWFVHAGVRLHTIGFTFKGNGALTNNRDGDMTTVDVHNARDNYFGGAITAGYAY